jgi:hypothetical protein
MEREERLWRQHSEERMMTVIQRRRKAKRRRSDYISLS